ncbi:MAG: hypothetical protein U0457_11140 [Candidatus Sericytochromatia bacterium]
MTNSILFLDLDDTIFQTKFRNKNGVYPATETEKKQNISYMTEYQKILFDMFLSIENLKIIPLTARILEQYKRTFLYNQNILKANSNLDIDTYSLYFGGKIFINNELDLFWEEKITNYYKNMNINLLAMYDQISKIMIKSLSE